MFGYRCCIVSPTLHFIRAHQICLTITHILKSSNNKKSLNHIKLRQTTSLQWNQEKKVNVYMYDYLSNHEYDYVCDNVGISANQDCPVFPTYF